MSVSRTIGVILAGVLIVTLGVMFGVLLVSAQATRARMDTGAAEGLNRAVTDSLSEAARGAGEIARNVSSVASAAQLTSQGTADTQKATRGLTEMAGQLERLVGGFSA